MITIKLSRDEELALREIIQIASNWAWIPEGQKHLESVLEKIQRAPDDTIMFMELVNLKNDVLSEGIEKKGGVNPKPNTPRPPPPQGQKETAPTDEELEEMGFETCPQCEDCGMVTTDLITKGDHHGGTKTVCRDRHFCHSRSY